MMEEELKHKIQELQKQLGKKQMFEEAVSSIRSLLLQYYPSASPSLRNSVTSLFWVFLFITHLCIMHLFFLFLFFFFKKNGFWFTQLMNSSKRNPEKEKCWLVVFFLDFRFCCWEFSFVNWVYISLDSCKKVNLVRVSLLWSWNFEKWE